jgi:hypothetical protein
MPINDPAPADPTDAAGDPAAMAVPATARHHVATCRTRPLDAQIAAAPVSQTASVERGALLGLHPDPAHRLSITAENETADPSITLYDEFGSYLAENDDWDGLNPRIDMAMPLQPGTYCIAMNALATPRCP